MSEIDETYEAARREHRAGRLPEAERLYRRVLELQPRHSGAAHLLGLMAFQVGKLDVAVRYLEEAIKLDAFRATYRADLGEVLRAMGRTADAIASYRKALEMNPRMPDALVRLGALQEREGRNDEAAACYQRALAIDADYADAHAALGGLRLAQREFDAAHESLSKAAQLAPDKPESYLRLGTCLHALDRPLDATACFQKVLKLDPDSHAAHFQLAAAYHRLGQLTAAIPHYLKTIEAAPHWPEAHFNLALALQAQGRAAEAIVSLENAIRSRPTLAEAYLALSHLHANLGNPDEAAAAAERASELSPNSALAALRLATARRGQGDQQAAVATLRRAVELAPQDPITHSTLLLALAADAAVDSHTLLAEHRAWAQRHAEPLTATASARQPARAAERLRVGYVSPHFRRHAQGALSLPLLRAHDHRSFEIYGYATGEGEDDVTAQFREACDHWQLLGNAAPAELAARIAADDIDILVDLAGHLAPSQLLAFARRPAAVQVAYLGHPLTTGMSAFDYRLTDAQVDPPGVETQFSEKLIRLPRCSFGYTPSESLPEVNAAPAADTGRVTFGWPHRMARTTLQSVSLWAEILAAIPGSRLIVLGNPGGKFDVRMRELLSAQQIHADRMEMVAWGTPEDYLRLYQRIDVALDSFPTSGLTTVLDALWMGVPAVTMVGETSVSRTASAALAAVGLENLVARSPREYVQIACRLAASLPQLAELRGRLRSQIARSPLADGTTLARAVEHAYRQMWQAAIR